MEILSKKYRYEALNDKKEKGESDHKIWEIILIAKDKDFLRTEQIVDILK